MIEDVIKLGAELDVIALLDTVVLEERPVPGVGPGRPQIGLAQAVGRNGECRRGGERAGIEPLLARRIAEHAAVQPVGAAVGVIEIRDARVLRSRDQQRTPRL